MHNQNCFLLSYLKYGDNDAVLHCFSVDSGYQSFFAKGLYASKNKKKAYLFPLNLLRISIINHKNGSGIPTISKIETLEEGFDFSDVKKNSILFFIADFLQQVLRGESQNNVVYDELLRFRKETSCGNVDSHISFIIRFLQISGVAPLYAEQKFLNPEQGIFSDEISHHLFDEEVSQIWKQFISSENHYTIRLKKNFKASFTDSVMVYYQMHFDGFYVPHSLQILRQIFG